MADNLEASAKIYGFRVDNFSDSTSKLVEEVRAIKFKKDMAKLNDDNEPSKTQKPKVNLIVNIMKFFILYLCINMYVFFFRGLKLC